LIYNGLKLVLPRVAQAPTRRHFAELLAKNAARMPAQGLGRMATTLHNAIAAGPAPPPRYLDVHHMGESNSGLLAAKRERVAQVYCGQLCDRARMLRELARLAALEGREMLACAYRVRAIRMIGRDEYHDLPMVCRGLRDLGMAAEAEAMAAMYEDPARAPERCREILDAALAAHRRPPEQVPFVRTEDRRHPESPRVSVIVSLYKAADKLPHFLHALRCQELLASRRVEVIFVDSGSPDDEYAALTGTLTEFAIPHLYVRTADRETIQTAWNRAIDLARAPYLTFLGVDETMTPDALTVLADALDAEPSVDWVQGDSLLTEVDANGCWSRDVMTYDRDGYTQNHVYLETCYLSWVGAMYRRSIHDRFGYYDGGFRATGDNEFKGRILPFIRTRRVPRLLGIFNNYPDPRATGSPLAELEDIRAWYLHRTLGGVRYALESRDTCEVEKMFLLALRYRKSYTTHISSDFEYAAHVAAHLRERLPDSPLIGLVPGVEQMLEASRSHDHPATVAPAGFVAEIQRAQDVLSDVQATHRRTPWLRDVEYSFARDNRHEQHAFLY
jgi:glycosyltransferase involved in cell wall biosynthesis